MKIKGGQIGSGYYPATATAAAKDSLYIDSQFFDPLVYFDTIHTTINGNDTIIVRYDVEAFDTLAECYSWPYDTATNRPFDAVQLKADPTYTPTDGKTWFGNVFGGGSGYYPYVKKLANGQYESVWNPSAGSVRGNTSVEITGGHILTSVYGGNEITSVGQYLKDRNGNDSLVDGNATVKMYGGTLGVPRNFEQIARHPVTCYLFGAGKGDPRTIFYTKTNVVNSNVDVAGGIVYGSIFGGGEDGHVVRDALVVVRDSTNGNVNFHPIIGTTGRSYVDGNVFGGGRGFSSMALTAGVVGGNIDVKLSGGTMLGSIYGGGRLASVGTYLVEAESSNYGKMQADANNLTHGHVTVDISGDAVIGNDYEAIYHTDFSKHMTGGNVFAGAMGRLTKLNGIDVDTLWPHQAMVKSTHLTIRDSIVDNNDTISIPVIKGNVYGGGEFGTVAENAIINISGGEIWRDFTALAMVAPLIPSLRLCTRRIMIPSPRCSGQAACSAMPTSTSAAAGSRSVSMAAASTPRWVPSLTPLDTPVQHNGHSAGLTSSNTPPKPAWSTSI